MPKFAANISMMFTEWDFLDRFAAAAGHGFTAVEFLFPYAFPAEEIARRLEASRLTPALFNLPPGDWDKGDRGLACRPERAAEFRASLERAIPHVRATGVRRLHLMSGHGDRKDPHALAAYKAAIRHACATVGPLGIDILIEPINGRDMPGYFLNDFTFAAELIGELALPNLKLQFDIYHRQILHGDVTRGLDAMLPFTGHVQAASVPMRNEPCTGELDDARIFRHLDQLGYGGYVGCEYRPAAGTAEGLGWFRNA
ncbi:TIM barrel protein [Aestuariivirga sp.]|uniref:hydroxypyruvate isomerase family protein n=1 Tax=Aestuariivirga sp. TaxID=2650926 RepID=UPI0025BDA414|nr:TIM barrel protein [Aestuariivirga sp.]MCA3555860.1 TIM barrel protein [Aestuariivirga sp.]